MALLYFSLHGTTIIITDDKESMQIDLSDDCIEELRGLNLRRRGRLPTTSRGPRAFRCQLLLMSDMIMTTFAFFCWISV